MSLFRRFGVLVLVVSMLAGMGAAGCGGATGQGTTASPSTPVGVSTTPSATSTAPAGSGSSIPADLAPNVRRDRREEPGVRSAAKPLVLGKARDAHCGKIRASALQSDAAPQQLLAGRLTVTMPAAAHAVVPAADAAPVEEESRVVYETGGEGLAVVARETFQLDPDVYEPEPDAPLKPASLDKEGPKFLRATLREEEGLDIVPVTIGAKSATPMRAYAARPREPNAPPGKDTALVLALLVAHPDGTLQSVSFFVRGELVRTATGDALVGCTRVAERIAATLAPGPRQLDREAGVRHVLPMTAESELTVRAPRDYVAVQGSKGARMYKLRPLSLYAGSITVSLGDDPEKVAPHDADQVLDGRLLDHPTRWRGKMNPKGGGFFFAAEPLPAQAGQTGPRQFLEVLVKAARQNKILDEMRGVAETFAVTPRASPPSAP